MIPTKNRIKLRWNRSVDQSTLYYQVYRSTSPDITRYSRMIMKVSQLSVPNWLKVEKETPTRISNIRYKLKHDMVRRDRMVNVFLDEEPANNRVREIDYLNGEIVFIEPPGAEQIVHVDYEFDGIEIIDDDIEQLLMMEYIGPPATDTQMPVTPEDIVIVPMPEVNGLKIDWKAGTPGGTTYYYRVEACDGRGNFSALSDEIELSLDGGTSQKAFVIERSVDSGKTWRIASMQTFEDYYEFGIDITKPTSPKVKKTNIELIPNQGVGKVMLELHDYEDTTIPEASPIYRIYARSSFGDISIPSDIIGPVYIKIPLKKVMVIRCAASNLGPNEIPRLEDENAIMVGEADYFKNIRFWDYPEDNETYRYAFYAIDQLGNTSLATVLDVRVPNATPPVWGGVLKVTEVPLII